MPASKDIHDVNDDVGAADMSALAPSSATDPLAELRTLKLWVRVSVYAAILGTEPFYYFALHYSLPQLAVGLLIGLVIASTAIEGAFGQMFKLRKRSAFPNL